MLRLTEFTADTLHAAPPKSLLLARTKYEGNFLVAGTAEKPIATFLNGENAFASWPTKDAYNWAGLIIPNVSVEVDQDSIVDTHTHGVPLGSLIRRNQSLFIQSKLAGHVGFPQHVAISDGDLPALGSEQSVSFGRWQIVLGEGLDKRVLWTVDVTPKTEA